MKSRLAAFTQQQRDRYNRVMRDKFGETLRQKYDLGDSEWNKPALKAIEDAYKAFSEELAYDYIIKTEHVPTEVAQLEKDLDEAIRNARDLLKNVIIPYTHTVEMQGQNITRKSPKPANLLTVDEIYGASDSIGLYYKSIKYSPQERLYKAASTFLGAVIGYFIGNLAYTAGKSIWQFARHLANPDPAAAAGNEVLSQLSFATVNSHIMEGITSATGAIFGVTGAAFGAKAGHKFANRFISPVNAKKQELLQATENFAEDRRASTLKERAYTALGKHF